MILSIYKILFILSFYFIVNTPKKHYNYRNKFQWTIKFILVYTAVFLLFLLIHYDNKYISNYTLPILIFMNIAWLIYAAFYSDYYKYKKNWTYYIPIVLIVYLLLNFKFEYLESKNGILLNPNKSYLYLYVVSVISWFFLICNNCNTLYVTLLTIYPLFFPLEEFLLHRGFSLYLFIVGGLYYNLIK